MGAYDSKKFAKQFSKRTLVNYDYIDQTVKSDSKIDESRTSFLKQYEGIIDELEQIIKSLKDNMSEITTPPKKGKNPLKRKLYGIINRLDSEKTRLKYKLDSIVSVGDIAGDKLYEVTQLLNSLMGIAVLPYEMYKECLEYGDYEYIQVEVKKAKRIEEIRADIFSSPEHRELKHFILELYQYDKWKTTFRRDFLRRGELNEDTVVFHFLRHLRNVTCHSGNNAISILPLVEGKIIEDILFYDKYKGQEFAMWLSVKELTDLVEKVGGFYQNSVLGDLDKTKTIEDAEKRVAEILNRKLPVL